MENLSNLVTFITEIGVLIGVIIGVVAFVKKIANGVKCLLRSKMLDIYYRNLEAKTIRQYEKENFVMLLAAYRAMKGNSFIDDVSDEVKTWKVIS